MSDSHVIYIKSSMQTVERRQAGKNAARVCKLFHLVSQLSQFNREAGMHTAVAGTLALSAGPLLHLKAIYSQFSDV